jgi:ATP-dependent Clp protease protease subunit
MTRRISKDWVDAYFSYGIDVVNRRIFLLDDIDEAAIGYAIQGIYLMESEDPNQAIELFIGSFGGSEYEMFALYDVMNSIKCPISTCALGKCMSAAPLLVAAGSKGERYATPNTWFMVHQSWDEDMGGRVDEVDRTLKHMKAMETTWYETMASHTTKPVSFWKRLCGNVGDSYFSAEKAIDYGIIDQIWSEK